MQQKQFRESGLLTQPLRFYAKQEAGEPEMFASQVTLAPLPPRRVACPKPVAPVGFGLGSMVRTVWGLRRVESLMAGDLLLDAQGNMVELRAVRRKQVAGRALVQIAPSAMGLGLAPGDLSRPLVVAAGQPVAVRDWRTEVLFGGAALAPAQSLLDGVTVTRLNTGKRVVVELGFDAPVVLLVNGLNVGAGTLADTLDHV